MAGDAGLPLNATLAKQPMVNYLLIAGAIQRSGPVISTEIGGVTGREIDMQMVAIAVMKIDLPRLGGR